MGPTRILVVDDEAQMRRVLHVGLNAQGYDVVDASSGHEALERVQAERFSCVLLDLNMPDMDGIATCRAIRTICAMPIIIISIRDSDKDQAIARQAGADDYLVKPFRVEELLFRIKKGLSEMRVNGPAKEAAPKSS
jgi:DNA-binding response OmpR family regulator